MIYSDNDEIRTFPIGDWKHVGSKRLWKVSISNARADMSFWSRKQISRRAPTCQNTWTLWCIAKRPGALRQLKRMAEAGEDMKTWPSRDAILEPRGHNLLDRSYLYFSSLNK